MVRVVPQKQDCFWGIIVQRKGPHSPNKGGRGLNLGNAQKKDKTFIGLVESCAFVLVTFLFVFDIIYTLQVNTNG